MKFRTEIERNPIPRQIDCHDGILLIGSCFSDHIGKWLEDCWLNVKSNPWGTLFNPASIAQSLTRIQEICKNGGAKEEPREHTTNEAGDFKLYEQNGIFYSFDHHGKWSGKDADELQRTLASLDKDVAGFYRRSKHVFITFGTSRVYEREGRVVANCHKFPANEFKRRPLSIEETADMWSAVIERDVSIGEASGTPNDKADGNGFASDKSFDGIKTDSKNGRHWIFTVSPIRHIKDTLHGNQLSKSTLLLAIDELQRRHPRQVDYLSIYELFNDELRDYRFYDSDMVHPSPTGIEAVREFVSDCCFTQQLRQHMREAAPIARALQHKPADPDSPDYKDFLTKTLKQKDELAAKFQTYAGI